MIAKENSMSGSVARDRHREEEAPYQFGFILNTTIGNMTRYLNLRKYAERIDDVDCLWAPITDYIPRRNRGLIGKALPDPLYVRASVLQQSWPVLREFGRLDAAVIHLFEADIVSTLGRKLWPKTLHVSSTDEAPIVDRDSYPLYPAQRDKAVWRQQVRLGIDRWRATNTDFFIPASDWVADILINGCGVDQDKVRAIHVGHDLESWTQRPWCGGSAKPKILFVGGEFERKGGSLLLDVFARHFSNSAELHLVTKQAPATLPPGVFVHADLQPNDGALARLYAESAMVVVPTTADTGPLWVFLEALATGRPVIGTDTGANSEVVVDGETGFIVPVNDGAALAAAMRRLIDDPGLGAVFGAKGRELVEARFDSRKNVPKIIDAMKVQVDLRRHAMQ